MLFKRYSSPLLLLDNIIHIQGLCEFIDDLIDFENEDMEFNFYLHKVQDKSFKEFKDDLYNTQAQVDVSLETTVINSSKMLGAFNPHEEE